MQEIKRILLLCGIMLAAMCFGDGYAAIVCAEEYIYDDLNRVIMVIYDDGGTVEYAYDSNGNIIETMVTPATSESPQNPEANGDTSGYGKEIQAAHKSDGATENTMNDSEGYYLSKPVAITNSPFLTQTEEIAALAEKIARKITEYAKGTFTYIKAGYGEE